MGLSSQLEKIRAEIEAVNTRATGLCDGLSEELLAWRKQEGTWSIAEILLHLQLTTETCLPALDKAVERARKQNLFSEGPYRLGMMGRFFVWYVEPPPVIRLPAPKKLHPLLRESAIEVLPQFLRSQRLMVQRVEEMDGIDIGRARFISPFASFVRMNLLALLSVYTAHQRRHIWQASHVRRDLETEKADELTE